MGFSFSFSPCAIENILAAILVGARKYDKATHRTLGTTKRGLVYNLAIRGLIWFIPAARMQLVGTILVRTHKGICIA